MTRLEVSAGYRQPRMRIVAHKPTGQSISAITLLHIAVFLVDATCALHVTCSGIRDRATRWTALPLGAVAGEGMALVLNRARCPLTVVVGDLGGARRSATIRPNSPTPSTTSCGRRGRRTRGQSSR